MDQGRRHVAGGDHEGQLTNAMILVIDNYDSFVHNLARYFRQLGCDTVVLRNDVVDAELIDELSPQAIILSPGPCTPDQAGCCLKVVKQFGPRIPILGICLGHQAMVQALGGTIVRSNEPIHGRQSEVFHNDSAMFDQVRSPFVAGRYHSLVANRLDLPAELVVTATTDDGTIMAVQHQDWPMVGLQFHPESILTESGYQLLMNFMKLAKTLIPTLECCDHHPSRRWENAYAIVDAPIISDRLTKQDAT